MKKLILISSIFCSFVAFANNAADTTGWFENVEDQSFVKCSADTPRTEYARGEEGAYLVINNNICIASAMCQSVGGETLYNALKENSVEAIRNDGCYSRADFGGEDFDTNLSIGENLDRISSCIQTGSTISMQIRPRNSQIICNAKEDGSCPSLRECYLSAREVSRDSQDIQH